MGYYGLYEEAPTDPPFSSAFTLTPLLKAEILKSAAQLVDIGWCRGSESLMVNGHVAYCGVGAIRHVTTVFGGSDRDASVIVGHVDDWLEDDGIENAALPEWNDDERREQHEVSEVLRRVAGGLVVGR